MTWIGTPRRRVEDRPLLTGAGRYTDDVRLPGILHVHFLRSPHAHATIARLDVAAARSAPGVVEVATGDQVRDLRPLSVNPLFPNMKIARRPLLVSDVVRAVGEPVAAVVAETAAQARDAAELVAVEWEPRPAVVDPPDAARADAPVLHPALGGNRAFTHAWRVGDVAGEFARAAQTATLTVRQPRLSAVAMEPRAVLAVYDPHLDELTVWSSSQAPFRVRSEIATCLAFNESRIRVIAPDVGGGFGVKGSPYAEDVLVAWLARRLHRPVKWMATRGEDLAVTHHGRGADAEGELAVDAQGRILGVRARIVFALGSEIVFSGAVPASNHGRTLPGAYVVPAVDIETGAAYTTTMSTGPYRGAGRPEGIFLMERLLDEAARALTLDPAEIRRRNFIPADAFPYRTPTGCIYDSGDYLVAFEQALKLAEYERLREQQRAARQRGEVVGVGLAAYVEPAAQGWESGSVRVERTGTVTIVTGSSPHGQGHETTWAQIAADVLGVEPEDVVVRHGDTRGAPVGFGTFGSRSTALGGSAVFRAATEVREKGRRIAANVLEASPADVVTVPGGFQVTGAPAKKVTWARVADAAYRGAHLAPGDEPGLDATAFFKADAETWSFGTAVVSVAIDRDTGQVRLTRLVWVDDAGTIVNPLLAEGQLHGGYAQGAGQALLEGIVYDGEGQLLTATLMDYAVPRLGDFPEPELGKSVTPTPRNPLGVKGLGEAGCIAVPPAIVNAVVDALAPFGCRHLDMPLTAHKVWRVLHEARA
ncbi:MAG TPA: xanthine dehydrogenase family protein molybdopterin-binding subunit [Methylomirabilota bacterium]|nr:xanthine dehydrogenase family protein molybdopterin-binding subunit [Methylomirabilota bacterium]